MLFVKGSDLPGASDRFTLETKHYVLPESCYDCRCIGGKIYSNSEVSLIARDQIKGIKPELYPKDTTHFFFVKAGDVIVNLQVARGRATALNYKEARLMHNYLLDQGMVCIQRVISEGRLFERLVKEAKRLARPSDYLKEVLPLKAKTKDDVYPSFFYEKGELSIQDQITDVENLLSALEERGKRKRPENECRADRPSKRARQ